MSVDTSKGRSVSSVELFENSEVDLVWERIPGHFVLGETGTVERVYNRFRTEEIAMGSDRPGSSLAGQKKLRKRSLRVRKSHSRSSDALSSLSDMGSRSFSCLFAHRPASAHHGWKVLADRTHPPLAPDLCHGHQRVCHPEFPMCLHQHPCCRCLSMTFPKVLRATGRLFDSALSSRCQSVTGNSASVGHPGVI